MAVSRLHRASLYCWEPTDREKTLDEQKAKEKPFREDFGQAWW
jgi:hypothetical protein